MPAACLFKSFWSISCFVGKQFFYSLIESCCSFLLFYFPPANLRPSKPRAGMSTCKSFLRLKSVNVHCYPGSIRNVCSQYHLAKVQTNDSSTCLFVATHDHNYKITRISFETAESSPMDSSSTDAHRHIGMSCVTH